MRDRARLVAWPLLVLGCASAPAPRPANVPQAEKAEKVALVAPRVRILDPQLAAERSSTSEVLVVPYGVNQNGTELVYALLERAAQAGARYVSDMQLFATFRWRGTPVECRTRVLLEGDPRLAAAAAAPGAAAARGQYTTDVSTYQPQKVDFVADDRELACHPVNVAMNKWRRVRDSERTADSGRLGRVDPESRELVTVIEQRDECEWRAVSRRTTRYDYEVRLGFVPPNWDHLQSRFARRKLVASTPTCYALPEAEVAAQPASRMTATAHRRGKVAQRLPDVLPSRNLIDPANVALQKIIGDKVVSEKEGCGCGSPGNTPAERLEHLVRIHRRGADAIDYAEVDAVDAVEGDDRFLDDE